MENADCFGGARKDGWMGGRANAWIPVFPGMTGRDWAMVRLLRAALLPATIRGEVRKALWLLDTDFRYPGLRSHPVEATSGVFEARAGEDTA